MTDPDGPVDQTFTVTATTRGVPAGPASPRVRQVTNGTDLRAAMASAAPGDIITLANGTYIGNFSISTNGTAANPIVIRGASRDGVVFDAQGADYSNIDIYSSYVQVENFTATNATRAINIASNGLTGVVVRGLHITNTIKGIVSGGNEQDCYIADNVLEGRLRWPLVYTDDGGAHSDDDGIRLGGFGNVIAHNRISGYGDAMKNNHWGARAMDVYGNEVLWSYDNCLELDESEGNVRAMRNRFTNCSTPLSVQPVFAGPAYILRNVVTNAVDEQVKFHALNIASPPPQPNGVMILHNTFVSAFTELQVQTPYGSYHTTLENNLFVAPSPLPGYAVNWDAPLNDALFDYNGYYPDGHFLFRWSSGYADYPNFATMKASGVETHGAMMSPGIFASGLAGSTNYQTLVAPPDATLSSSSSALNRGVYLPNVSDGYTGAAPDLGALELGCALPVFGPRPAGMDESNEPLGCDGGTTSPPPPPPPATPTGTAAFLTTDATTQGNWKNAYGKDGAIVVGDSSALPTFTSVTPAGNSTWVWAASTGDVRAAQKRLATDRVAGCWFAPGSFTIALNFTDGLTHQVALYALDWDNYYGRRETVEIVDGNGSVLDSRSLANFTGGQYLVWNLSGRVSIRVTNTNSSSNAVISGLFFGTAAGTGSGTPAPSSTFVKADTTTRGNWKGVYGSQGAIVIGDSTVVPNYASIMPGGISNWVWAASTSDSRAPLKGSSATDRIASCWFSPSTFNIALNFTDGLTHQVALYALDWDNYYSRTEKVEILDSNGAVVDTRTLSGFTGGQYLVWKLGGKMTIRVTNTNPSSNAVMSALFFDPSL